MVGRNVVLFIAATAAGFVAICNAIPQIKAEAAGEQTTIGGSPEELAAAGKRIFLSDRAQCLTCHSLTEDPKARCPNQDGLGERASRRKPGLSAAEYLVESVYNPNAFIVSGYPRNQMQPVNKPPIALGSDEILAVIAYLNTLGGKTDAAFVEQVRKTQDPWIKGLLEPDVGEAKFAPPIFAGDVDRGRKVLEAQECLKCHRIGTEGREVCPDLTAIGASQSPNYILESLLDPSAVIVKGYRQVQVNFKGGGRVPLRGRPMKWIPDQEHPEKLILNVEEDGERIDREIDLAGVASVGDSSVGVDAEAAGLDTDEDLVVHFGAYVSGDKETGVVLKVLADTAWVEKHIPPRGIDFVAYPTSPMPSDMPEKLAPREIYDLVAYLVAQKGKKE